MNGASAVYGMTRVGMPAPSMVGRPVRWKTEVPEPVVIADEAPLVVAELAPEEPPVVLAAVEAAVDALDLSVVCVAVLRSGRSVRDMAWTEVVSASSKNPADAASRRVCDRILRNVFVYVGKCVRVSARVR